MSDISTVLPDVALLLSIGVLYFLCLLAPILVSGFVVLRHRQEMPRRLLFIVAVTILSYGFLNFIGYAVNIPVAAYLIYIAPQLEASGHYAGQPFLSIARFGTHYWWFAFGPVLLVVSIVLTSYLGKRWSRIAGALGG